MSPIDLETARSARFLAQLIAALDSSAVPPDLSPKVVSAVAEAVGDACVICLLDPSTGKVRQAGSHHREPKKLPALRRSLESWLANGRHVPLPAAGFPEALVVTVADEQDALEALGSVDTVRQARLAGIFHLLIASLTHDGLELGFLWVASTAPERPFTVEKVGLAREIARELSAALAHLQPLRVDKEAASPPGAPGLRLQTILDSIPQGLIVADLPAGRVIAINKSLVQMVGYHFCPEAPISQHPEQFGLLKLNGTPYLPEELPWVRTATTGKPAEDEMVISRPEGNLIAVLCSTSPILADGGGTSGVIGLFQNITDQKEFERQKDEFLAMVSHELRTPLASIKGSAQFLQRRMQTRPGLPLGKTEMDMLQIMDQQVNRLVRLVSDLTQYSIIQVGRLELFQRQFDLGALASTVSGQMQATAPGYDISIVVNGDTRVNADPERIEQVLYNLVSNAIKATRAGKRAKKPVVEVSVRDCEDGSVLTSVHDDGVGIEKGIHGMVFQRLYRGPDRSHEGMGLGLYVSKQIIDAHGGRIWFLSEEGKGTTFFFCLPAAPRKTARLRGKQLTGNVAAPPSGCEDC